MDKQTLSNYGWLVIVTLILAVMLAFATPFGTYVGDGVVSIANGYVQSSNNATDKDNISKLEQQWMDKLGTPNNTGESNDNNNDTTVCCNSQDIQTYGDDTKCLNCGNVVYGSDTHSGLVPVGGRYGSYNSSFTYYEEGTEFPSNVNNGDLYYYGDYTYRYNYEYNLTYTSFKEDTTQNGWGVRYNGNNVAPEEIALKINSKPITSLRGTFHRNETITTVPSIPNTVTDMAGMLYECSALVDASYMNIPACVTDISSLFYDCASLTYIPTISHCTSLTRMVQTYAMCDSLVDLSDYVIPENVNNMEWCFKVCSSLTKAPVIPSKVNNIGYCFIDCPLLTSVTINSTPSTYTAALLRSGVTTINGSCGNKTAILSTVTN